MVQVTYLPTKVATIIKNGRVHTFVQGNATKDEFIKQLKQVILTL